MVSHSPDHFQEAQLAEPISGIKKNGADWIFLLNQIPWGPNGQQGYLAPILSLCLQLHLHRHHIRRLPILWIRVWVIITPPPPTPYLLLHNILYKVVQPLNTISPLSMPCIFPLLPMSYHHMC